MKDEESLTSKDAMTEYLANWKPAPHISTDRLDNAQAIRLAHTLDVDERALSAGELPLPWHWVYFPDWPPTAHLAADGHPADGRFQPPIPHRRRMFAGSHLKLNAPLHVDVETEKRSGVERVTQKHGRSGVMLFVTVCSQYFQRGDLTLTERQTIVYRSDQNAQRPPRRAADTAVGAATWTEQRAPTAATLFRYSALTFNSHRIHYDQAYAREVEGYPDLVIQGPLLATYMAELARRTTGRTLREFGFRLNRPLYLGDRFHVKGELVAEGSMRLRIVSGDNVEHVTGTAALI